MAVGDIKGAVESMMPNVPKISLMGFVTFIVLALLFFIIVIVVTIVIIRFVKYNKKIIIFEKIGNNFIPARKDRACEITISPAGDTVFYLLKHKKYLPRPTIQTGKRTYWFFIREDGEWINFGLKDLDEESRLAGAFFLDKEMRYARTQIQKGLKERYEKEGFWKQYGTIIVSISFIVLIGVMTWLLFDKWIGLAKATEEAVKTAGTVMEKANQILGTLDRVCSGGGGYTKVGG